MKHNCDRDLKIHVSNMHPKVKILQYYICRGDPLFQSPIKERNSSKKSNMLSTGLQYYNTVDGILKYKLVEHTAFMNETKYDQLIDTFTARNITKAKAARVTYAPTVAYFPV